MEEGRTTLAAFSQILGYDPGPIEMVLPELAAWRVCGMRLAAVSAERQVGIRCAIHCRGNRRIGIRSTLAANSKGPVVIFMVRTSAKGTVHAKGVAEVCVVTPRTTVGTVGHPHVKGCFSEEANH